MRCQNNLDNLGSLMQDVSLDVTKWEETEESIKTKWRFRCVLGLPWKPTLAAAGVSLRRTDAILFLRLRSHPHSFFYVCIPWDRDGPSRLTFSGSSRVNRLTHLLRSRFSNAIPKAFATFRARRQDSRVLTLTCVTRAHVFFWQGHFYA